MTPTPFLGHGLGSVWPWSVTVLTMERSRFGQRIHYGGPCTAAEQPIVSFPRCLHRRVAVRADAATAVAKALADERP